MRRPATSGSCSDEFQVISEVGFKDAERSENLPPSRWIECIREDLDAGAVLVTLEARESGRSGICRPNGELRFGLIEELLSSGDSIDEILLFEAPSTELQNYFVKRVGPNVNLGNVAATAVSGSRPSGSGLRADTLSASRRGGCMTRVRDAFHLAIPAYDLDEAEDFYVRQLGCKLARRYPDRITLDFFGDQLVCHLAEAPDRHRRTSACTPVTSG